MTMTRTAWAHSLRLALLGLASLAGAACGDFDSEANEELDDEEVTEASAEIQGGSPVTTGPLSKVTVGIMSPKRDKPTEGWRCSGVIVSTRHVLTAAHCLPHTGGTNILPTSVSFYTAAGPIDTRSVIKVVMPVGTNPWAHWELNQSGDLDDVNGKFADIAILELNSDIPSSHEPAHIADAYPGASVSGWVVGIGDHDGYENEPKRMLYTTSLTRSTQDQEGFFLSDQHVTNGGDSGGPFLALDDQQRVVVLGVLHGYVLDPVPDVRDKYTSLAHHRAWLHEHMREGYGLSYAWPNVGVSFSIAADGDIRSAAEYSSMSSWTHVTAISKNEQLYYHLGSGLLAVTRADAEGKLSTVAWDYVMPGASAVTAIDPGVVLFDRHVLLYRSSDGSAQIVNFNPSNSTISVGTNYGPYSFSTGWSHIARTHSGDLLFYNSATGLSYAGRFNGVDFPGTAHYLAPGWTHLTPTKSNQVLFYRGSDGASQMGSVLPDWGTYPLSWYGNLSPNWKHIVATSSGLVLFQDPNGLTVTGRFFDGPSPTFKQYKTFAYGSATRISGWLW